MCESLILPKRANLADIVLGHAFIKFSGTFLNLKYFIMLCFMYLYVYICIEGSGTYPCTLLSQRFLTVEKHHGKHKCISKDGAFCCSYSGDRLGRFFRWASSLFLNIFTDEAVTTSAGRSVHIFTTFWLKVNLRRSSLDRSFRALDW